MGGCGGVGGGDDAVRAPADPLRSPAARAREERRASEREREREVWSRTVEEAGAGGRRGSGGGGSEGILVISFFELFNFLKQLFEYYLEIKLVISSISKYKNRNLSGLNFYILRKTCNSRLMRHKIFPSL